MKSRNKIIISIINTLLLVFVFIRCIGISNVSSAYGSNFLNNYKWIKNNRIIAHGMGSVDGKNVTNSMEAFESNYKKGIRLFEVDLILTRDDLIAARHDWMSYMADMLEQNIPEQLINKPLSYTEFKQLKINHKYHPLGIEDIIQLMISHEDAYFITDTKEVNEKNIMKLFGLIDECLSNAPPSVRERLISQVYSEKMYKLLKSNFNFSSYIFSTYKTHLSENEIVEFAQENNIKAVTIGYEKCSESIVKKLKECDIYTFVHPINDIEQMTEFEKIGVYGFYTDILGP